jgi:hypothetical protein
LATASCVTMQPSPADHVEVGVQFPSRQTCTGIFVCDVAALAVGVDGTEARLACMFQQSEMREQVGQNLEGLIGGAERKNRWQLAEHAGDEVPWRMQVVLGRSGWDADCARDICCDYVMEQLGDPTGVVILDNIRPVCNCPGRLAGLSRPGQ